MKEIQGSYIELCLPLNLISFGLSTYSRDCERRGTVGYWLVVGVKYYKEGITKILEWYSEPDVSIKGIQMIQIWFDD